MSKDSLTITDNRTGKDYDIPIELDTIRAMDLRQIKVNDDDFGMMSYDPSLKNTASAKSSISFIDGEKGILRYRGYPIEQLAEKSTYLEVAYLLLNGELPTQEQLDVWVSEVTYRTFIHENLRRLIQSFSSFAHPMHMFISTLAAMSSYYPDARQVDDPRLRHHQIRRIIAKVPTVLAYTYRHLQGLPIVMPDNDLTYSGNFLNMLFKMTETKYQPDPIFERAVDVLFILHADHEQNCSASVMRAIGSGKADPYCALTGAAASLSGPLHGGANEAVLRMLNEIGNAENVPAYIERVKKGEFRLMGFGHRVYKNYDPRAAIIKDIAEKVFEVSGRNPLIDIAIELERVALEDDYFISHKLYPNVDFYSGIIYQAMGLPVEMYTVLFAMGRTVGWLTQWHEMLSDPEQRITRPRQIYTGAEKRDYVPMSKR
jgi:citrate synthase